MVARDSLADPGSSTGLPGRKPGSTAADPLVWEYDIPLLTNPFLLWDVLRVYLVSALIVELLVALMGLIARRELFFLPLRVLAIPLGIIAGLFVLVTLLLHQNRFPATFTIDPRRARAEAGRKQRMITRAATVLSVLLGSGRALGSSLLAYSQEVSVIPWREVRTVRVYRRFRVISLSNSWRTVMRLYCPPGLFDQILERVQAYAARGERWRATRGVARRMPYGPYLLWAGLTIAAVIATQQWEAGATTAIAVVAGGLVLVSGLVEGFVRRALGLLAAGTAVILLVMLGRLALEPSTFLNRTVRGYEYDTPLFLVALLGNAALLVMSVARLVGRQPARPAEEDDTDDACDP